jgi:hypothetical protein
MYSSEDMTVLTNLFTVNTYTFWRLVSREVLLLCKLQMSPFTVKLCKGFRECKIMQVNVNTFSLS